MVGQLDRQTAVKWQDRPWPESESHCVKWRSRSITLLAMSLLFLVCSRGHRCNRAVLANVGTSHGDKSDFENCDDLRTTLQGQANYEISISLNSWIKCAKMTDLMLQWLLLYSSSPRALPGKQKTLSKQSRKRLNSTVPNTRQVCLTSSCSSIIHVA